MILFEDFTGKITDEERDIIIFVAAFLKGLTRFPRPSSAKPIPAPKFINLINREFPNLKRPFKEVRLRKIVNYLRCTSKCYICSSGKGYWEANSIIEMDNQIQSIEERAASIQAGADGLRRLKEQIIQEKKVLESKSSLF
jgi:hypothetical protein